MNKEKKIWLLEQFIQQLWVLVINLSTEAARVGGNAGRGYAIIAEECRHLHQKMTNYVGIIRFDGGKDDDFRGIADVALQMNLLAVNGFLENLRGRESSEKSVYRSISIHIEEIRNLACKISELYYEKKHIHTPIHTPIPEVVSPLKSTENSDFFLQYSIGNVPLIENANYVMEIDYPAKNEIDSDIFNLRGLEIPIIDLYKRFNLKQDDGDRQTVMIISRSDKKYAVPIEGVYGVIHSKIGYNVPPKASHVFADYTRECWDLVGDDQFLFVDWDRL